MITKEELKDRIVALLGSLHGCKAADLITKFGSEMTRGLEVYDLSTVLAELLHEERIVEFIIKIDDREKSYLLPSGAEVRVVEACDE